MTRVEKALTGNFSKVPTYFKHAPTPNKPAMPSTASLSTQDLDRFNDWVIRRENGSLVTGDIANLTAELSAVIASYEQYFATAAYQAWSVTDQVNREWQWRLYHVDVAEAVNIKATQPISADPLGAGTAAPAVGDITVIPDSKVPVAPQYVSTGGKSPELVFGDDGDIVTTS